MLHADISITGLLIVARKRGFNVESYGCGKKVRVPGRAADQQNVYDFGEITYEQILKELAEQDERLWVRSMAAYIRLTHTLAHAGIVKTA